MSGYARGIARSPARAETDFSTAKPFQDQPAFHTLPVQTQLQALKHLLTGPEARYYNRRDVRVKDKADMVQMLLDAGIGSRNAETGTTVVDIRALRNLIDPHRVYDATFNGQKIISKNRLPEAWQHVSVRGYNNALLRMCLNAQEG